MLSSAATPRVAILTNVLPSYRQGFYDRLIARRLLSLNAFCLKRLGAAIVLDESSGVGVEPASRAVANLNAPGYRIFAASEYSFILENSRGRSRALVSA